MMAVMLIWNFACEIVFPSRWEGPHIILAGAIVTAAGLDLASPTSMECRQSWHTGPQQPQRSALNLFSPLEAACLCWAYLEAQK